MIDLNPEVSQITVCIKKSNTAKTKLASFRTLTKNESLPD